MRLVVEMIALDLETAVPQAAAGEWLVPLASDLPINPAIGFEKPLVAERSIKLHVAETVDFGGGDQRGLHIFELLVEIVLDQAYQRAIECKATREQQHPDPDRGDCHHAARKAAARGRLRDNYRIVGGSIG